MTTSQHSRARPARDWYWWLAMLASSLAVGIGSVLISTHLNREGDRRFCTLIVTMDDTYRTEPPSTPTGVELAHAIEDLRQSLDCPPAP